MGQPGWRWYLPCCEDGEKYFIGIKHTANNHHHSRTLCWLQGTNDVCVCVSVHQKPTEKIFGFSFLYRTQRGESDSGKISDSKHGGKKPAWSSINYARVLPNQWIHSVSACGRWTNTCRLSGAARIRFIFRASLSHFSCLVLEGRACSCDFSNARDLQLFYSLWYQASQARLCRTSGFLCLQTRTKGPLSLFHSLTPEILTIEEWDWVERPLRPGQRSGIFSRRHSLC